MVPDSKKLQFGPYRTPRFKYGAKVVCEARGEVKIVRLSNGRIPWPMTSRGSLVLYGDLVRAVRREANRAVAFHWGVSGQTVTIWRKALGIKATEGTTRWRTAFGKSPPMRKALKAMHAKSHDPARAAAIAAAKRGKRRPAYVVDGMRKRMLGKKPSRAAQAKMSASHLARGTRPPWLKPGWTQVENELLRTLPAREVAQRTGRTLTAVYMQRSKLGINDGRKNNRVMNPAQQRQRMATIAQ